ncbi:Replication factor C subunit 1 [Thelohanellus kitauei]|uniref:Replication factor C subunit 1 n=1 Tax=Thelohanellus kitauei TaxID=669202 RepID=A0A0C2IAA8_THEKT|nr:Replication factor C subunit 1 [Thelohanellus kitauei]
MSKVLSADDGDKPFKMDRRPELAKMGKKPKHQNENVQVVDPLDYFSSLQKTKRKLSEIEFNQSESILSDIELNFKDEIQQSFVDTQKLINNDEILQKTDGVEINQQIDEIKNKEFSNNVMNTDKSQKSEKKGHNSFTVQDYSLKNLVFVISGTLEHRESEVISTIYSHGGRVESEVTPGTSYMITGLNPHHTQLINASKFSTQKISERELYTMISTKNLKIVDHENDKLEHDSGNESHAEFQLWVDKYKPKNLLELIGQQGLKSPANKLVKWLQDWNKSRKNKPKNFFAGKEDGSIYKASLISGAPGIGKSTTARLVCQELGYDIFELNASDTRNKKCLDTILSASLQNLKIGKRGNKSVVIMDEVDGMSGNEDRGGIQEIISLIKTTQFPIICICNDRMNQKIRSLSNHCFDLRFYKPRSEQIKSLISKITATEGIQVDTNTVDQVISCSQNDIRSTLNNLQMLVTGNKPNTSCKGSVVMPTAKDVNEVKARLNRMYSKW